MSFYQKYKQLLPLSVWLIFSVLAIGGALIGQPQGNSTVYLQLSKYHYIGFTLLIACVAIFFFWRSVYKYAIIFSVLAGVLNVAWFSGANFVITIGVLPLQPLSLMVGIWFFIINFGKMDTYMKQFRPEEQEKMRFSESEKIRYREKYASYSDAELNTIRSNVKYFPEARRAAEELLSERVAKRTQGLS